MASVRGADSLPLRVLKASVPVPDNFCWQPQDLTATLDQGQCGSCWAHATVSILGDRVSVQTSGAVRTALEVQQVMECSDYLKDLLPVGCKGNEIYIALQSLVSKGTKLCAVGQYPRGYSAADSSQASCVSASDDKYYVTVGDAFLISEPVKTPGDEANKRNIENMKNHIFFEGPIIGTFLVYSDFQNYDGTTIYEPSQAVLAGKPEGAHAIELIGWGTDPASGVGYWVCRNSWGASWPASHKQCAGTGTFYMKMGANTCEIEAWCAGAHPTPHNTSKAPKDAGGMYANESPCTSSEWHDLKTISNSAIKASTVLGVVLGAAILIGVGFAAYNYMKKRKLRA
jgi:C1A family cysteine protease